MASETTTSEQTELVKIAQKEGLPSAVAESLVTTFVPLAEQAAALIESARSIVVSDPAQVTEIKASRTARLKLREVRIEIENSRKALKEDSLRRGQAIDAVARFIRDRIEPEEARLMDQEKIAERIEAEGKAKRKAEREAALVPFGVDPSFYALADMPDEEFDRLLGSVRAAHEAKLEAERKAEADRIAAERARAEEEARIRAENERLRKEAEERERQARIEREKAEAEREAREAEERKRREAEEARLRAEKEAREKAERELRERREAEERRKREEEAARRKAARAPDREKIASLAAVLHGVIMPSVQSEEARALLDRIENRLNDLADWIVTEAVKL